VTRYYHAPLSVASQFEAHELPRLLNVTGFLPYFPPTDESPRVDLTPVREFNLTLCLGKEWYRFPSHYLIPSGINVEFIKSNFDGHLPRHFEHAEGVSLLNKVEGTRYVPKDLNDLNREEPLHYVRPIPNSIFYVSLLTIQHPGGYLYMRLSF
jgi:alpha-1,2-mannosyltransferase